MVGLCFMPKNNKKPYADSTTKTETTIAALTALLEATPAAEELSSTWTRSGSQTRKNDGPRLKDLKEFLDSGKATGSEDQRGIPMWIVVSQTMKMKFLYIPVYEPSFSF